MTFVSVAEATTRLGIDAKTLHRWLADAQLPLSSHPHDGRKKGVSSEHLEGLARLHHRRLAPLAEDPPVPLACPLVRLPADLLALPEALAGLQAQIAALQQHVSTLTCLLEQHAAPPAAPHATVVTPTRPACPARPPAAAATKPPPKPTHVLPLVEYTREGHYRVICPKQGVLSLQPDTADWFAWLATRSSFRFVGKLGHFTAHREVERLPNAVWRAHRKVRNHPYNQRLAHTPDLTISVLEQAAATLRAHLT